MGKTHNDEATKIVTKKFIDLQIGDVVQTKDGRTAKVLSRPGRGILRNRYGVEMRIADGELTWSEMEPDATVFLA